MQLKRGDHKRREWVHKQRARAFIAAFTAFTAFTAAAAAAFACAEREAGVESGGARGVAVA
eukprot:20892-Eustigmatos_ZCMA.PRE.1